MSVQCYRCGKAGNHPSACKHKSAKCYLCHNVGNLARAHRTKKNDAPERPQKKAGDIHSIEEKDDSSSDSSEHLHSILQLGTKKFDCSKD